MVSHKAGDLVWVHIGGGYGWWPCQVMEPRHVADDRRGDVLRLKRPGCVLVHCHGDKTFNWFDPRDVEPISKGFEARSGQKHKSPGVKRFFKLALEEVQELLCVRSSKPTATEHFPVDFNRPETYEHLLRDGNSEEPEDQQGAAEAMQYPSAAAAADAQLAGSGAALLEWLQRAAAMPGAACKDLYQPPTAAATAAASAAMRLLWSCMHDAAVQQHRQGPGQLHSPPAAVPNAAGSLARLAPAASAHASKQQKLAAGAKRKAPASASGAAVSKKAKGSSSSAAGSGKQQKQGKQAQDVEDVAAAAVGKPSKKRKQPKSAAAAAAAAASGTGRADSSLAEILPPLAANDPQLQDEQLMTFGGPVAGASIRKAAQLLPLAAVSPESVTARLTLGQAKSIALLLRWREAAMARSSCRMKGEVGPLLRGALERAGAMPIRPLSPQQKPAKQRRGSLQQASQAPQPQQDGYEAAAWAGLLDDEDGEGAEAAEAAGQHRRQRRKLAGRGKVLRDDADVSGSGESGSECGDAASSDGVDGEEGGRLRRGAGEQQGGRGASARAAAAAAKQKGRVADLMAVKQAGSLQEKRRAVQQHLQHMGMEEDAGGDDSNSDEEGAAAGGGGGVGRSEAAAAAAADEASQFEKVDVMWKDYKARVPASEAAFVADLQRYAGERGLELKIGTLAKHEVTMSDCYAIFKLVADKGGCRAAQQIKAWTGIARAWNPKLMAQAKNVPSGVRTTYERHLLGYENHVSHGCQMIVKTFKTHASKQKQQQQPQQKQMQKLAKPARVKQEAALEAKQQQQQRRMKQEAQPVQVKQEARQGEQQQLDRRRSLGEDLTAVACTRHCVLC
ncbi:hypothetical protein COO60DRAFT_977572 [Scenedesmus sp. NREL 46B-D3]|nr:hypothetical protein COO60DRAFT_977572 [Scenedesmus sp. NREL 46B-D3]